jgi:hypothetical protein
MFRSTDIVFIAAMVAGAAFTYQVKQSAENEVEHISRLKTQIRLENDSIDLLKADWSLLTRPSRLQKLVGIYQQQLELQPVEAHQIVTLDELPSRPIGLPGISAHPADNVADSGRDRTVTGGIAR